jgi:hypothetical protein
VAIPRYAESNFGGKRKKPVAHFRGRISGETTDVSKGTTVDRTGQAKFSFVFHRWIVGRWIVGSWNLAGSLARLAAGSPATVMRGVGDRARMMDTERPKHTMACV